MAVKEDGPEGEAAVANLLAQATEAAVHGALRYKSAQLLVSVAGAPLSLALVA